MKRMVRKAVSLGLAFVLSAGAWSLAGSTVRTEDCTTVQAKAATVPIKKYNLKVNENKKVNLGKKYQKNGVQLAAISYSPANSGIAVVDFSKGYLMMHGISKGLYRMVIDFSGAPTLAVNIMVTGEPKKSTKGLNGRYTVQKRVNSKVFQYDTCYLDPKDYNGDGKTDCYYFNSCAIKNISKKARKPDVKIQFYDRKKKLVGTYQLSKDKGTSANKTLKSGEIDYGFCCGVSAEALKVSTKKFNTIKYWKVCTMK